MREPVFAVDEVRYEPGYEPAERLFMGDSFDAIERYRPSETSGMPRATFTDLRQVNLPWYEILARIDRADEDTEWPGLLGDYFKAAGSSDTSDSAVMLYISDTGAPKLFDV